MKPILQEYLAPSVTNASVLLEDTHDAFGNKAKTLYMEGICIQGNIRNHNGRIYPKTEIQNAVNTIQEQLKKGISICGEVDHPNDLKINLDRVSHCIVDMKMNGNDGIGKLKILPTPMGKLIQTMIESGVKLGVSSRGSGNVNEYNGEVSDYEIVTIDVVCSPSGPDCYPNAIYESLMNFKNGKFIMEGLKETPEVRMIQQALKNDIMQYIKSLKL